MKKFRISLLWQVLIAIATGIALGQFLPVPVARIFVTFNGLFGNFLTFAIPLIIIGLIIPAISDLGKGAGRLLLVTAAIAYGSTVFSGFFTYFSGRAVFPELITESAHTAAIIDNPCNMALKPYFTVEMPAPLDIMTALLLSFCIGLGLSVVKGNTLRMAAADFRRHCLLAYSKSHYTVIAATHFRDISQHDGFGTSRLDYLRFCQNHRSHIHLTHSFAARSIRLSRYHREKKSAAIIEKYASRLCHRARHAIFRSDHSGHVGSNH